MIEKDSGDTPKSVPFDKLRDAIELSHKKMMMERGNRDADKRAWARVMIQAIGTYGTLRRDVELEQLAKDVEQLKKAVGIKDV